MSPLPASSDREFIADTEMWNSLKSAIAASSGFQRWQLEHLHRRDPQLQELNLDGQVQRYLRETLETLAY